MFNKLIFNHRAQGIAYAWAFGLISLFALGILFITFDQVFRAHLNPLIINEVNSSTTIDDATKNQIYAGINQYMIYWGMLPFILFFVVIIYLIVVTIRRERQDEQY